MPVTNSTRFDSLLSIQCPLARPAGLFLYQPLYSLAPAVFFYREIFLILRQCATPRAVARRHLAVLDVFGRPSFRRDLICGIRGCVLASSCESPRQPYETGTHYGAAKSSGRCVFSFATNAAVAGHPGATSRRRRGPHGPPPCRLCASVQSGGGSSVSSPAHLLRRVLAVGKPLTMTMAECMTPDPVVSTPRNLSARPCAAWRRVVIGTCRCR